MGMTKNYGKQNAMILKTLDELVPKSHIVRKMERHLDLTFIYDEVSHLYSSLGQLHRLHAKKLKLKRKE